MTLISFLVSSLFLLSPQNTPYSVAHRGGHIKGFVPENSPAGVAAAKKYGYRAIECDVHYTKDKVLVIMHDRTINRTMVNASDLSPIKEPVVVAETTFAELRSKYVMASSDPAKRTPIPTFEEELDACKKYGIIPMMHTQHFEAYKMAKEKLGDNFIAFSAEYDSLRPVRQISDCLILWDPDNAPADEAISKLKALGGRCGISSMKHDLLTAEYVKQVRDAGFEVQSSIFKTPREVESYANGVTYVLSDFALFPAKSMKAKMSLHESDKTLRTGEKITFTGKQFKYSSLEIQIDIKGSVEVIVGGKRHYTFTHADGMQRIGSWRFYDTAPTIEIVAKENSTIKAVTINQYKY